MAHGCNPSTQEMEAGRQENLRLAWATQDYCVLKKKKRKSRKKSRAVTSVIGCLPRMWKALGSRELMRITHIGRQVLKPAAIA